MARRSIFISYAHEDRGDVKASAELLRAGGVQVFIDVRGIDYGERWQEVLRKALDNCERVLVFWSLAARTSKWVDREWRYALALGKRIVPTLLDATPLPAELSQFQALSRYRGGVAVGRDVAPAARASASRAAPSPAVRLTLVAAAVSALAGGQWVWVQLTAQDSAPPRPSVQAGAAGSGPGAAASSPPALAPAPTPVSPVPSPAAGASGFAQDLAAIERAGTAATEPASTAALMRDRQDQLARLLADGRLHRYNAVEFDRLAVATERASRQVQEVRDLLTQRRGSFETRDEARAFAALAAEVDAVAAQIRLVRAESAAAASAPPALVPGPAVQASAAASAPPDGASAKDAGALFTTAWLLAGAGVLAALIAAVRLARRSTLRAEARRFVDQVFSA